MGILAVLSLLLCVIHRKDAASHSLNYSYTAVKPGIDFPEFTAVGTVDDVQFMHYDSNIRRMIPKTEWIKESEAADYCAAETQTLNNQWEFFRTSLRITMEHFNQTEGVHTLQNMFGCEWDDETDTTESFDQYGYDGENFVSLDTKSWSFIAVALEGDFLIQKWNDASHQLKHRKQFLTDKCAEQLKKFVRYGNSSLERTVPPQVSLLQRNLSSPVTCHVTGFYPHDIMVTWQKNRQTLHVDIELEETVPNGDGTFQSRSHLRVKPEDWKRDRYTCTVQHNSLELDIILPVTEENIKRNMDIKSEGEALVNPDGSSSSTGIIIGCVVGPLLLLSLAAIGVFMWKKPSSEPPVMTVTGDLGALTEDRDFTAGVTRVFDHRTAALALQSPSLGAGGGGAAGRTGEGGGDESFSSRMVNLLSMRRMVHKLPGSETMAAETDPAIPICAESASLRVYDSDVGSEGSDTPLVRRPVTFRKKVPHSQH